MKIRLARGWGEVNLTWAVEFPILIALPHVCCDDPRYIDRLFDSWLENLGRFLKGRPLKNRIDPRRGY